MNVSWWPPAMMKETQWWRSDWTKTEMDLQPEPCGLRHWVAGPESLHPYGMREHKLRLWPALTSHGHESKRRPGTTFILSCSEHAAQQTSSLNRITGAFTLNKTSFIRQLWSFAINLCKNTTEPLHIKTFLSFYRWNIFANTRYRYTAVPNLIINGPLHWFINVGLFKTVGN